MATELEQKDMGRVLAEATIENLEDLYAAKLGLMTLDQVRRMTVSDALVDTGATGLSMPRNLIARLGLDPLRVRRARTSAGSVNVQIYGAAKLTIQGRECFCDVTELP